MALIPRTFLATARKRLSLRPNSKALGRLPAQEVTIPRSVFAFEMRVQHRGKTLAATVHQSGGALVVELEPCLARPPLNPLLLVQGMVTRVHKAPDLAGFLQAIAKEVRSAAGFDRVMV